MPVSGRRWQAALIVLVFGAVAAAAFTGWWYARESPPHQGPIVLITADNLPAGTLPSYGARRSDVPAIDALATDGVVFDRAYAHSPQTLPAHASLLSGQLPFENGVRDDAGFALRNDARTLAELLRNRGFSTGAAVSTFLLRRASGVAQGFSFFDAELAERPDGAPTTERDSMQTIDAAERWVETQDSQRFLLFLQVDASAADAAVGRIVRRLQDDGLYDDATILFVGDHGDTGAALSLADDALRVPLIIKQPDSEGAGRRVAAPVQHIDLLPTILDLVRAPVPSALRGRSLRSVLDAEDGAVPDRPIYAESLAAHFTLGGYGVFGLTSGQLRFVRADRESMFDLQTGGESLPMDSADALRLRTVLDGLLAGRPIDTAAAIVHDEEAALAALGHLPGPRLSLVTPVAIEPEQQAALVDAVRASARLVSMKDYAGAIQRLRGITRAHPELVIVHYETGALLARTGRLQEAAAALERASALEPDHPALPMALAAVYLRARAYEQAQRSAATAVALAELRDPMSLAAGHEVAMRVALARADFPSASLHAEAAQQADNTLPLPAFVQGRMLYEEARYEEALKAFQEAETATTDPGRPLEDLHLHLGDTLSRLDRYQDAEAQYRAELQAFPMNTRAYTSLAMLYRASNREDEAGQVIEELMEAAPTPEGYASAARLWTLIGERSRADAVRADARRRFRGDPSLALLERER